MAIRSRNVLVARWILYSVFKILSRLSTSTSDLYWKGSVYSLVSDVEVQQLKVCPYNCKPLESEKVQKNLQTARVILLV